MRRMLHLITEASRSLDWQQRSTSKVPTPLPGLRGRLASEAGGHSGRASSITRAGTAAMRQESQWLLSSGRSRPSRWSSRCSWWSHDHQLHGALAVVALVVAVTVVVWSPAVASMVAATGRLLAVAPLGPVAGQVAGA